MKGNVSSKVVIPAVRKQRSLLLAALDLLSPLQWQCLFFWGGGGMSGMNAVFYDSLVCLVSREVAGV